MNIAKKYIITALVLAAGFGASTSVNAEISEKDFSASIEKYLQSDAGVAKIGLGYQDDGTDAIMGVSVSGEASGIKYVANYSDLDSAGTHMGVGVGYTTGALMLHANYGVFETVAGVETDGFGAAVNYDLGGGAVVMAGYGSDMDGAGSEQYSVGLGLSF